MQHHQEEHGDQASSTVAGRGRVAYSRREALRLGAVVGGGILLGGCGARGSSSSSPAQSAGSQSASAPAVGQLDEPLSVLSDFDYIGAPGSMNRYWEGALERFEEETGTTSEHASVAYANLNTRLEANHAARQGPVVEPWYGDLHSYRFVFQDVLEPLDEWVGEDEIANWMATGKTFDGLHYYCPLDLALGHVIVNSEMAAEAGIDTSERFESWRAFLDALEQAKATGVTPALVGGADFGQGFWFLMGTMEVIGDPLDLPRWQVGEIPTRDPSISTWMRHLEELREGGYINSDAANTTHQQAGERFLRGEAMFFTVQDLAPFRDRTEFEILPIWKGSGPHASEMALASDGLVVTSYSSDEEKAAAARLAEFLHVPEEMDRFHEEVGTLPADRRFTASNLTPTEEASVAMQSSTPTPWYPAGYLHGDVLTGGVYPLGQKILSGTSADAAIDELDELVTTFHETNPQLVEMLHGFIESAQ